MEARMLKSEVDELTFQLQCIGSGAQIHNTNNMIHAIRLAWELFQLKEDTIDTLRQQLIEGRKFWFQQVRSFQN
jgi:hypothetical protein